MREIKDMRVAETGERGQESSLLLLSSITVNSSLPPDRQQRSHSSSLSSLPTFAACCVLSSCAAWSFAFASPPTNPSNCTQGKYLRRAMRVRLARDNTEEEETGWAKRT